MWYIKKQMITSSKPTALKTDSKLYSCVTIANHFYVTM